MSKHLLTSLKRRWILETVSVNQEEYYRIKSPAEFIIPKPLLSQIQQAYDAEFEIGGLILFSYQRVNKVNTFVAQELLVLENTSDNPRNTYQLHPDTQMHTYNALENNLIALQFHTHPTKSENFLQESVSYLQQLNTSDADQVVSLRHISYEGKKLRLPDVLIVGNGSHKSDMFVGFYNGLICPPTFKEHKKALAEDSMDSILNWVERNIDTPQKKFWAGAAGLGLLLVAVKYPKAAIMTLLAAGVTIPQLVYKLQNENQFFAITSNEDLSIAIPQIDNEVIIANESSIHELRKGLLNPKAV